MQPRTIRLLVALGLALLAPPRAAAADEPARALVKRVLEAAPRVPFVATMTLTIAGGVERKLELSHKMLGDTRASYLEVTSPLSLKDTRFLFLERTEARDEQFMYLPTMRRVTQVSEDARAQPFLGSEYYVSDLVSPELDAFDYAWAGEATVLERACRLVTATPKDPEGELYARTVLALDPQDLLILRAEFFDTKGRPFKVWTAERLERIDGVWTARVQQMANVQDRTVSRLTIDAIRFGVDLPDATFSRTHLAR